MKNMISDDFPSSLYDFLKLTALLFVYIDQMRKCSLEANEAFLSCINRGVERGGEDKKVAEYIRGLSAGALTGSVAVDDR